MCGFEYRSKKNIAGDEVDGIGLTAKWCHKDQWDDQKWGKTLRDSTLESRHKYNPDLDTYMCPENTYA